MTTRLIAITPRSYVSLPSILEKDWAAAKYSPMLLKRAGRPSWHWHILKLASGGNACATVKGLYMREGLSILLERAS